ncbi:alpha/beta hydrolase [Candidatus Woesearchaeota archaeon]|nr:alpha/beta hydrolase [Candidatus Woesearchaeota archaeon]
MNEEELGVITRFSYAYKRLVNSLGELKKLDKLANNDLPTNILFRTFLYYESNYSMFHKIVEVLTKEIKLGNDYVLYRIDDSVLRIEKTKKIFSKLTTYQYLIPFLEVLNEFITAAEPFLYVVFTITPEIYFEIISLSIERRLHFFSDFVKKNAIILHGGYSNPNEFWFPSIKSFLENKGYEVWAPQLPYLNQPPDLNIQLPFVLQNGKFTEQTTIIAHSAGCPLTLSILENINVRIHKAVFVAGFADSHANVPKTILQGIYDWKKIRQNVKDIIFINSDDDPWEANHVQGKLMFYSLVLGGALIVLHGQGHFGSVTYYRENQPYNSFPFLEKLLSLQ